MYYRLSLSHRLFVSEKLLNREESGRRWTRCNWYYSLTKRCRSVIRGYYGGTGSKEECHWYIEGVLLALNYTSAKCKGHII